MQQPADSGMIRGSDFSRDSRLEPRPWEPITNDMTDIFSIPFSRRTFLRGVGVTMALPWLESLPVWGDETPQGQRSEPPVRLACLFAGNGFHSQEWWAKGEGAEMELGKVLEPLHPFREKLLFLRGLYNEEALIGGIHSCQTGNLLTGAHLANGGEIRSGISMDQVMAKQLAGQTKVRAWCSAASSRSRRSHKNYSMIYSSHISWSSPTTPTPLELYPALAFDRLFRDDVGRADASVLDACSRKPTACGTQVSQSRPAAAGRIPGIGPRSGKADRKRRQEPAAARLAADARQARHAPPGRRHPAGHRRAHAADVRHPGAGLPHRHDARLHA